MHPCPFVDRGAFLLLDAVLTVFWGVVVLVVLVLVHELGHFVAARSFGVRVTEFMIGMPGPNIGFERNGTRYGITCVPLGGYNRIAGMEGGEEDENLEQVLAYTYRHGAVDVEHVASGCGISEEDAEFALRVLDGWGSINKPGRSNKTDKFCAPKVDGCQLGEARLVDDPKALLDAERKVTYRGLSFGKRLVVLFAGPLMNVVLAVALFLVAFCVVGVGYYSTTVDELIDGQPAAAAGIQEGDDITNVNGQDVEYINDISTALKDCKPGDTVEVVYQRDGQSHTVNLVLGEGSDGQPVIGFYSKVLQYRMGPVQALKTTWTMIVGTIEAYARLINPSTAAETVSQSSSIVGISVMAKKAIDTSLFNFLYILGAVSLSLAVINLFPIPPLDGGKIITELIEKAIRRPVPMRVVNAISIAFIALMLVFFVYMVRQDFMNFIL